jgi:outer membrane murein-binding lipoprotein Lpp
MINLRKNIVNAILIGAFILATLLLAGCGDNELVKGITDVVKKSVEGEVTKKAGEVKKQFDQVINLGTGKSQKEDGQGAGKDGNEKSEKGSGKESEDEKD